MITDNGGGNFTVTGANLTDDIIVNSISSENCQASFTITPPTDCTCPDVMEPTGNNVEFCAGDAIPDLVVSAPTGLMVNWFDAPTCDPANLIASNITILNGVPAGTYYAQAIDMNNCTSDCVAFEIIENPLPTITASTP